MVASPPSFSNLYQSPGVNKVAKQVSHLPSVESGCVSNGGVGNGTFDGKTLDEIGQFVGSQPQSDRRLKRAGQVISCASALAALLKEARVSQSLQRGSRRWSVGLENCPRSGIGQ